MAREISRSEWRLIFPVAPPWFKTAAQEVFAVTVLPEGRYAELINDDELLLENSFTVPNPALAV